MASIHEALVVADGDVDAVLLAELAAAGGARPWLVAADGGAARVLAAGLLPDVVVGDLDSLATADRIRLEERGVEIREADRDKDESDMELCLLAAIDAGASRITVLGGLGPVRPEHSVANLLLLADPRLDGLDVSLAGRGSRIWRIGSTTGPGHTTVTGRPGDFVSLFALGGPVEGIRTSGLRFPLIDETLRLGPSRGLSNELEGTTASIGTGRGLLLVIHTDRSAEELQEDPHAT